MARDERDGTPKDGGLGAARGEAGRPGVSPGAVATPADDHGLIGTTISHYRILARIGRGGMGVVYEASDLGLDRTVALKFLPPLLGDDPRALDRFVAEARAASALDHPNICTIYEIGQTESGQTFIAMAFYEGETLKEKIAHGPLPLEEAIEYARQIASGLSQAHEAGIVHRDIKPANIIVTPDGVAKILDFGLAKVEDQQLTTTGELLGTLDYMSPEQVEGGAVDGRTDVWSLGAMLFEMITGQRPFAGGNRAAQLYAVIHQDAPSLSDSGHETPAEVSGIVDRCLAKDPTERFADGRELLLALGGSGAEAAAAASSPSMRGLAPAPAPAPARARRPAAAAGPGRQGIGRRAAAIAALATVAVALLALPGARRAITGLVMPEPVLARASTLVAVIPSPLGSTADRELAEGLTHTLTGELSRLGAADDSLWVLPAAEVLNLETRTALEVYRLHGVDRVVSVTVTRLGEPTIELVLVDPSQGGVRQLQTARLPFPLGDGYQDFLEQLPGALATLLGIEPNGVAEASTGTANPEAFDFYTSGLSYLSRRNDLANLDYADRLFSDALEMDDGFAQAHAGLCETRFEKFEATKDTTLANLAVDSCDRAYQLGSDLSEVLVPVASIYLRTGRTQQAKRTLEDAFAIDSLNADAHRWMARVHEQLGDEEEAWREFRRAIAINPRVWVYRSDFAASLMYTSSRFDEAIEQYRQVRVLAPDNFFGDLGLAFAYLQIDRADDAMDLLRPLVEARAHGKAFANLGYAHLLEGRFDEAATVLEVGSVEFPDDVWVWRHLAHAKQGSGRRDEALAAWREVVEVSGRILEVDAEDEDALDCLAEALAQLGDREGALGQLQRLVAEPGLFFYHVYHVGRTFEMLGERDLALQYLETAVRDYNYNFRIASNDPWLADLRQDPGFEEIRAWGGGGVRIDSVTQGDTPGG